ncbi:MAG TPA: CBS domain-containing protein [Candidatus Saccharimonadales bacterium]|nr:CBS domain-containing protein [Candidatus Saccharimonadales bacterium]
MSTVTYPDSVLRMFVFLSEILDARAVTPDGRSWGRVDDLLIVLGEMFPRVTTLVLKNRRGRQQLEWSGVDGLDGREMKLRIGAEDLVLPFRPQPHHVQLRREILDKQIVDTHGAKLERVNDLHLLVSDGELRVVHVDVGFRGLVRRLGFISLMDATTDWLFSYQLADHLVSWKYVQPLASDPSVKALKLNLTQRSLADIHPSDLADIMEELDVHQREVMFRSLDVETAAEALEEVDEKLQIQLLESVGEEKAADILEEMAPDEAVDLLQELPEKEAENLMQDMEVEKREELQELLSYDEGSAGALMTTEYVAVLPTDTCAKALEAVRSMDLPFESSAYVFVVEADETLRGTLSLLDLLHAGPDTPVVEVMETHPKTVPLEASRHEVAAAFAKYDFVALPVVDEGAHLKGLIALKDAVTAVSKEFSE